jgi:hypothetical protein
MPDAAKDPREPAETDDFARQAAEKSPGVLSEFWGFLKSNGNWWLTPLIIVLLVVGLLVVLSSTVLGPFLYPLF